MSQFTQTIKYAGNTNAPRKGSPMAAGYDVTSAEDITIATGERAAISTGLRVALPAGWYGKIEGRSGLAFNKGIFCFGGVIDADYRGEIKVLLTNTEKEPFHIKAGDRIAQMIIHQHWNGIFEKRDELSPTARNTSGFGSSGTQSDLRRQPTLAEMWQMPDGRSEAQLNRELAGLSSFDVGYPRD
jgi:dUTP pyrophosphatase